jgi:hypothetical protein
MITRREFSLATGVAAVAATSAAACSSTPPAALPTSAGRTSFPALKHVDAGLLNVGYAADGPADGPPVILLHGRPSTTACAMKPRPMHASWMRSARWSNTTR